MMLAQLSTYGFLSYIWWQIEKYIMVLKIKHNLYKNNVIILLLKWVYMSYMITYF